MFSSVKFNVQGLIEMTITLSHEFFLITSTLCICSLLMRVCKIFMLESINEYIIDWLVVGVSDISTTLEVIRKDLEI